MTKSPRRVDELFGRSLVLKRDEIGSFDAYPFSIPAVRHLDELRLDSAVTLFAGENGSGKSTLVEAIAVAAGFNPEGGSRNMTVSTRPSHSALHKHLRLVRGTRRPRTGYFLRGELLQRRNAHRRDRRTGRGVARGQIASCAISRRVVHRSGHESVRAERPVRARRAGGGTLAPRQSRADAQDARPRCAGLPVHHLDALAGTPRISGREDLRSLRGRARRNAVRGDRGGRADACFPRRSPRVLASPVRRLAQLFAATAAFSQRVMLGPSMSAAVRTLSMRLVLPSPSSFFIGSASALGGAKKLRPTWSLNVASAQMFRPFCA